MIEAAQLIVFGALMFAIGGNAALWHKNGVRPGGGFYVCVVYALLNGWGVLAR